MKEYIKMHFEKLLLITLLVALMMSSVSVIWGLKSPIVNPPNNNGEEYKYSQGQTINSYRVSLRESYLPYSPGNYIYCRNSSCNYLISGQHDKCSWCGTKTVSETVQQSDDTNNNLIPDTLELSWGLKLDDVDAIHRDIDIDGFSTIDEFLNKESPIDSKSHPSLLNRCSFAGVEYKYIPLWINNIEQNIDRNGVKRVYIDGKGFYREVGEKNRDMTFLSTGKEADKEFAIVDVKGKQYKVFVRQKTVMPGWPKYKIKVGLHKKPGIIKVIPGEKFYIKSIAGENYKFQFIDFDSLNKRMNIKDVSKSELHRLGFEEAMKKPLE